MRSVVLLPLLLAACEPPPAVDLGEAGLVGDPVISVVLPIANEVVPLDDDCVLRTYVAWDVDNFTLVSFTNDDGSARTNADGEGHVHVIWAPPAYESTFDQSFLLEQSGLTVGSSLAIAVELHENEHGFFDVFDFLALGGFEAAPSPAAAGAWLELELFFLCSLCSLGAAAGAAAAAPGGPWVNACPRSCGGCAC